MKQSHCLIDARILGLTLNKETLIDEQHVHRLCLIIQGKLARSEDIKINPTNKTYRVDSTLSLLVSSSVRKAVFCLWEEVPNQGPVCIAYSVVEEPTQQDMLQLQLVGGVQPTAGSLEVHITTFELNCEGEEPHYQEQAPWDIVEEIASFCDISALSLDLPKTAG